MSRATLKPVDENIFRSLNHRDTIISSLNGVSGYNHIDGAADMNAISVGAGLRCNKLKFA